MPAGWVFTPAPGILYMPDDGLFYSDFEDAFPHWTGGSCWHMVTGGPRANDKRGVIDSLSAMRDA